MLTQKERELLDEFFDELSNYMDVAGCNDYVLPNTPENVAFLKNVIQNSYPNQKDRQEMLEILERDAEEHGNLTTQDALVFNYLRCRLERELDG